MSSSDEAGGLKELANNSISSRNLVAGMPRSFFPSVMDSRLRLATSSSASCLISDPMEEATVVSEEDIFYFFCFRRRQGRVGAVFMLPRGRFGEMILLCLRLILVVLHQLKILAFRWQETNNSRITSPLIYYSQKLTLHFVFPRSPIEYLTQFAAIFGPSAGTTHLHPRNF